MYAHGAMSLLLVLSAVLMCSHVWPKQTYPYRTTTRPCSLSNFLLPPYPSMSLSVLNNFTTHHSPLTTPLSPQADSCALQTCTTTRRGICRPSVVSACNYLPNLTHQTSCPRQPHAHDGSGAIRISVHLRVSMPPRTSTRVSSLPTHLHAISARLHASLC